jgi:hypothetical protein
MPWAKSKSFLEKTQLGSIIMYLICLGGYTIEAVGEFYDWIRADIFGFTFFSLFIASTILLRLEDEDDGTAQDSSAPTGAAGSSS